MLLLALGAAQFIANGASFGLVQPLDPVLKISMRTLFWIVGAGEVGVALVCLFGRQATFKLGLVLWMTTDLVVYQGGFLSIPAHHSFSNYLDSLARAFALSPGAAYWLVQTVVVWLWLGSAACLLWHWLGQRGCLKCACFHCGGHISFPAKGIGWQIDCPHCGRKTMLRAPETRMANAKPSTASP